MNGLDINKTVPKVEAILLSPADEFVSPTIHSHDQSELVMPVTGSMICEVNEDIWMVPAGSALWIPSRLPHTTTPVSTTVFCLLFVDSRGLALPDKCCTIAISPLIKEIILHLTKLSVDELTSAQAAMLIKVLLEILPTMPEDKFNFALPYTQSLRAVADILIRDPADRRKVNQWASLLSMSERTFARLVIKETGMTFGLWRKQLHIIIALQLLVSGQTVQFVSEHLGYDSVSAFITMFKNTLGKSPKSYIKQYQP